MVQEGNGPGQKLEREQEGGKKTKEEGSWRRKTGTETDPAMTIGVAEEATIASAGDNRACSDGGCGENECGGREETGAGGRGSSKMGSLCDGSR